jgi:hypothetical protein
MNLPNEMKMEILKNCQRREFDILRKCGDWGMVCEEKSVLCEVMWNTYRSMVMNVIDKRIIKYSEVNLKMVKEWDNRLERYWAYAIKKYKYEPINMLPINMLPINMLHYELLFKEMLKEKKEDILEWMLENNRVDKKELLRDGLSEDVNLLEYMIERCDIDEHDLMYIFNMESLKFIIDRGLEIPVEILEHTAYEGELEVLRYLVEEKNMELYEEVLKSALENNKLEVIRYLVEEKKMEITDEVLMTCACSNVEIMRYIMEKREMSIELELDNDENDNMYLLRYFKGIIKVISDNVLNEMLETSIENLNMDNVVYLVDEKKVEITRDMFVIIDDIRSSRSITQRQKAKKVLRFLRDRYKRQK